MYIPIPLIFTLAVVVLGILWTREDFQESGIGSGVLLLFKIPVLIIIELVCIIVHIKFF